MTQQHQYLSVSAPEDIVARIVASMQAALPDWLADESDPGVYWADAAAYELTTWADQVDGGLAGVFPATATGAALDQHLQTWGLPARGSSESVEDARERLRLRILSLRPDTPEFYLALVNEWDAANNDPRLVSDASTEWVLASLELLVYVLTATGPLAWTQLSQAAADSLQAYLATAEDQSEIVSALVVQPEIVDVSVTIRVVFEAGVLRREQLLTDVRTACQGYLNSRARLNVDISYSEMVEVGRAVDDGVAAIRVLTGTDDLTDAAYLAANPSILHRATIASAEDVTP